MYRNFFKRIFDFFSSILIIIILTPILLTVSVILLFTGENEVFYLQFRVGYKNTFFKIFKFTTMVKDSPNLGTGSLTLRNDPRILPMGHFLRKTKINELPQIFNVLFNHMSIVGPRPQMEVDFKKFPPDIQKSIYNTKPGITGIGSIVFRDEERWISECKGDKHAFYREKIAPYKGELELWYQKNISFLTDIKLIFLTAYVILFPKSNIYNNFFNSLPKRPKHLRF